MGGLPPLCNRALLGSSSTLKRHWRKAGPLCEIKLPDIDTPSLISVLWPGCQMGNAVYHRSFKTVI